MRTKTDEDENEIKCTPKEDLTQEFRGRPPRIQLVWNFKKGMKLKKDVEMGGEWRRFALYYTKGPEPGKSTTQMAYNGDHEEFEGSAWEQVMVAYNTEMCAGEACGAAGVKRMMAEGVVAEAVKMAVGWPL